MPKCSCPSCHPERSEAKSRDRTLRYDWEQIQRYHDDGHTYRECVFEFGLCAAAWGKARSHNVKLRLLRSGVFENRCDICGLTDWRGTELVMHLDHVDALPKLPQPDRDLWWTEPQTCSVLARPATTSVV